MLLNLLSGCAADYGMYIEPVYTETVQQVLETTDGNPWVQQFEVLSNDLDILWIVDTSCSMSAERGELPWVASDIAAQLAGQPFTDLSWRMGVISADPSTAYAAPWASSEADVPALFDTLQDSSVESGLSSAVMSLGWDVAFHRQSAHLLIIFVADEDDGSAAAANYEAVTASVKPAGVGLMHSAVVHLDQACTSSGETIGDEYIAVADALISICEPKLWASALAPAKTIAPYMGRTYALDYVPLHPVQDTVLVSVDGVFASAWVYDSTANTVTLDDAPPPGSWVTIAYVW